MNIELLNTGLKLSTSNDDGVWQNCCCWALMYRLGFNNATRVADMVDADTYGRLPVGNKGIMVVGASEDPYEEPGFEAYVARLRRSVAATSSIRAMASTSVPRMRRRRAATARTHGAMRTSSPTAS